MIAGIAASLAMDAFQAALAKLASDDQQDQGEPATAKAADRVSEAAVGKAVPDEYKPLAGNVVHYGFGALLGLGYGIAAEYWPQATAGRGTAFGAANALVFDEAAVPAAGLGAPPWEADPSSHLYALSSHLVFGAAAEEVRRLVRTAI
jgi:putative membrane protein